MISEGLRGPEGPLFHGRANILEFFRKLYSGALPQRPSTPLRSKLPPRRPHYISAAQAPNKYPNQGARLQTASHQSSGIELFELNYSLSIVFIGLQVGRGRTSEVQLLFVYDPMSLERVFRGPTTDVKYWLG
jgi:hypothetical protein